MPENAGKMRTRITPNMDSFYAVTLSFDLKDGVKFEVFTLHNKIDSFNKRLNNITHNKTSQGKGLSLNKKV